MHRLKDAMQRLEQHHQTPLSKPLTLNTPHTNTPARKAPDQAILSTTQIAIDVFLASLQPNGEIGGLGHWQTANGLTSILLHDLYTSRPTNLKTITTAFSNIQTHYPDFCNEFCDDSLWWANALLDLYSLSAEQKYFYAAVKVQEKMSAHVIKPGQYSVEGKDMGGGVFWTTKQGEQQVNSISTGLFAEVSARLAGSVAYGPRRRRWIEEAEESVDWIFRCRFNEHEGIVLDHVILREEKWVDWAFTYLTGQCICACVALFLTLSRSGDGSGQRHEEQWRPKRRGDDYLRLACEMAETSMKRKGWVNEKGILTEEGTYGKDNHEAWENDDAVGFKSVLLRALAKLNKALHATCREENLRLVTRQFIERQYACLCEKNTNGKGQYGPWWAGPMALPTSHSQLAVLDVMAAVHV